MQRELVFIAITTSFLVCVLNVNCKVCQSIDVRNHPSQLSKLTNCTIIAGSLKILLFDNVNSTDEYNGYTFPDLYEITGYLLFFRVPKLASLKSLFPRLRVIRGVQLFTNYALVLFQMPDLKEIGLTNLLYIARGGIKVDKCPHVCFVDTIDWKRIGATKVDYTNHNDGYCQKCLPECKDYCWNSLECQQLDTDKCHEECLGCKVYNSPNHCNSCKNFENNGTCVADCPENRYLHNYVSKCLSEYECKTMLNGTWWTFGKECVQSCPPSYEQIDKTKGGCKSCGENCVRNCSGVLVDNLSALQELTGCTHINGSLELRISDTFLQNELEKSVGKIVEIDGYLKIGRSNMIHSLNFLKNLRIIHGKVLENQQYALFVYENHNLQKLWNFTKNFTLQIINGTYTFNDNPQLCLSEIEKLANATGKVNYDDMKMFKLSNGQKAVCNFVKINFTITNITSTNITLTWKLIEQKINDTIIGYTIYYMESNNRESSMSNNKDVCDEEGWKSVFGTDRNQTLLGLSPYTKYAFYIKTYHSSLISEQSDLYYFTTSSHDPSEPVDVRTNATSDHSINITWDKPKHPNGELIYYSIDILLEEDYIPQIYQRNYCHHPHILGGDGIEGNIDEEIKKELEEEKENAEEGDGDDNFTNKKCLCKKEKETIKIFKDGLSCSSDNNLKHSKCDNFQYMVNNFIDSNSNNNNNNDEPPEILELNTTKLLTRHERNIFQDFQQTRDGRKEKVDPNATNYEVTNLKHYSLYLFFITACNKEGKPNQCSPAVMVSQRTKKNINADNIFDVTVNVIDDVNAFIRWTEPTNPNSVIVGYQIEHKRIDLEHPKPLTDCITYTEFVNMEKVYKLMKLLPGKYSIRVQAISLAGLGKFSQSYNFNIKHPDDNSYWLYAIIMILFILITSVLLAVYCWYKKKYAIDNVHLIAKINPDYEGAVYVEDKWECDRNDIEILKELGKGSFGTVYEGIIKSKNCRCAIKTIPETADRIEFLNEGSVMKSFCNCHHVIRLLGIVSRGQPPLVVMELMERGDLKSFLRRCRQPSQNLTSNELYRMAIEIADGMAYLAAKKFVHRDLAARNCMVDHDRTVKIGDFGMARDIYETDYYKKETVGLLPVRWMAPESLTDGVFTSDSDVWSYGIVLWEMATLAEQPYQGLSNEQVLHFVKNKGKLERPNECSDLLFDVMDACWMWRPIDRPEFIDIVERLVTHVGEDFRLVSFCYSREGVEHKLNAGKRIYNPPAMSCNHDDEYVQYHHISDEEIGLCTGESSRPNKYLPFTNQRYNNMPSSYHLGRSTPDLYPHSS